MRENRLTRGKPFPSPHGWRNRLARMLWGVVWLTLFRPSPVVLHGWRRWVLRMFGARIANGVHVYPSAKVWAPWLLEMNEHSCLAPMVDCYNVGGVKVGAYATVSQYSYLCGATHDYTLSSMPLRPAAITVGERAWVAADVFIGPGVTVGAGAVVGARSSVYRDVPPWTVVGGNPAKAIKQRTLADQAANRNER